MTGPGLRFNSFLGAGYVVGYAVCGRVDALRGMDWDSGWHVRDFCSERVRSHVARGL